MKNRWSGGLTYVFRFVVLVNGNHRLSSSTTDLNGGNFLNKPPGFLSRLCFLVRADAVVVLVLACEAVVVGAFLALQTHVLLLVGVGQAVLKDTIDKGLVAGVEGNKVRLSANANVAVTMEQER